MDLPVISFIQTRLAEADTTLETRKGTAFYKLFINPQQFMLQPFVDTLALNLVAQSVKRILGTATPDTFDTTLVDDLLSNIFVSRDQGLIATSMVRVFYNAPLDKEFPALSAEFTGGDGSLSFFNSSDILITSAQMALQVSGNLFYMDVPVQAAAEGDQYNLDPGGITTFINDPDAVSVTNITPSEGGLPQETNTQVLNRAPNAVAVRDLETNKGINAILSQNFPAIGQIQTVGMGDPEMMRDIIYNAHVGGNTDVYLKFPKPQTKKFTVKSLDFDTTRQLPRSLNRELSTFDLTSPISDLGTPFIVVGSMMVTSNTIETRATVTSGSIPPGVGIDLSANQWIKIGLDGGPGINIKVSGANPAQTQRFEIINLINSTLGQTVAVAQGTDRIVITSQQVGSNSMITFFSPDSPRTDATAILFPAAVSAGYVYGISNGVFQGIGKTLYFEGIDYQVDYTGGHIAKLPGSAIRSGDTLAGPASNGIVSTGSNIFSSPTPGIFASVQVGDSLIITGGTGITAGTYTITQKIDNQNLQILNLNPIANASNIVYSVVSNQVVVIRYQYNPLSVDIGPLALLADGMSRGIRPGRTDFTITDVAFLDIISIEEADPDTGEGLGIFLDAPGGYGRGGYGKGGYGIGGAGGYQFIVVKPVYRFSAFEESMIVFNPASFGKSYIITYRAQTEILAVHNLCRNDLERVTGADVLPKNFVPGIVDIPILVRRDATNISTPADAVLATMVSNYVTGINGNNPLDAAKIVQLLEAQGLTSVELPFEMKMTTLNTDGSTTVVRSQDRLIFPPKTLPKRTDNFVTARIVHFYGGNITVTSVV